MSDLEALWIGTRAADCCRPSCRTPTAAPCSCSAYMNREALAATRASGRVTFWSRSKQQPVGQGRDLRAISSRCAPLRPIATAIRC